MTFRIIIFLCIISAGLLPAQTALNMELFSQFNRGDTRYSGSWAYIDSQGNEYALLGARTGTAAYSIDDAMMTELGFISGPISNWREITVIGDKAYVTTEGSSDSTGMQVVDLQYLPDSLQLLTTYDLTFTKGHILQKDIYSDDPYVYVNGTQETDGIHILDVSDPSNPVEVGLYAPGYYIHDCFVKGNLLFAAAFYEARMDILDISDKTNPLLIGQIDHFDGNTHSSWVTEDDHYLMVSSELDGKPARIYNIEDLNNITEVSSYTANPLSLVHNPYIRGSFAFISHNTEGIRVVDLYDPEVPVEVGYYDTWDGASGGFHGLWSACPFFPSGKIIGGNREDGLYVWTFNNAKAGRIYATILDSLNQEPLTNLELTILETNDTLLTDFNGQIKWGALPGTYTLVIEKEGYFSKSLAFDFAGCDELLVNVLLQEDIVESTADIYKNLPELKLSPNPSDGLVSLDVSDWEQGSSLQVFDAIGQDVFTQQVEGRSILNFDLGFLQGGTYYVLLMDSAGQPIARSRVVLIP
jgi:choice-of-anchor B domain-containing protein